MTKITVTVRNFPNALKNPCSVHKEDGVSRLYMDLYSAVWSVVRKLTAMWVFGAVSKAAQSFESTENTHQITHIEIQKGLKTLPQ